MMFRPMSLLSHVKKGDWEQLEDDWTELMLGDASTAPVLEALPHAARRRELQRLMPFLRDHAEVLTGADRASEAAELLGTAMLAGGSPGELSKLLFSAAESSWSEESWWTSFCDISGFFDNAPDMRVAWRSFTKLLALKDGKAVYHAKGWGIGAIESVNLDELEVDVRFASGRRDRFPFTTAVDIFEVLGVDDPRALVVVDPDGLKRMVKDEPLELLRSVVRRHQGQVTYAQLKTTMALLGVDGTRFSGFWRKARKLAEESGWFEITGAGVKVQVRLNTIEADPAESLRRQLERSPTFAAVLQRVRDVLSGKGVDETLREAALDSLAKLADVEERDVPRQLAAWMLLRDTRGVTPEGLANTVAEVLEAEPVGDRPALWNLFHTLPNARDQERAVELLQEVRGEAWLDEAARELVHAPPGMARPLVDVLDEAGRIEELRMHYAALLLRPTRNARVFICLAEHLERGDGPGVGGTGPQRAAPLLQLATHLKRQAASDVFAARARLRLTTLLAEGKSPLLRTLLKEASEEDLRRMNSLVERGVDREIDRMFTSIVVELAPEIFRGKERPFWESQNAIWTTREGLSKREEELRVLRDIKIPENSEAIGKAASYGDLSENSEWEAAIEEQRNLTTRAQEIAIEIRAAELIENAAIPEATVCPGVRVTYRQDGEQRTVGILGPWDSDAEDVISYRSPLASGMLGLNPGGKATVKLPQGQAEVEVVSVEPLADLGTA